jgi:hypothetical protein
MDGAGNNKTAVAAGGFIRAVIRRKQHGVKRHYQHRMCELGNTPMEVMDGLQLLVNSQVFDGIVQGAEVAITSLDPFPRHV